MARVREVLLAGTLLAACATPTSSPDPRPTDTWAHATGTASASPPEQPGIEPRPSDEASSPRPTSDVGSPTHAARATLDAIASDLRDLDPDPEPERTTNDTHYLASNERRHDLYKPDIDDIGGIMLGVGSDQTYVMAPWARTELLVVVDFDQKVVDLHTIHGVLLSASPTVEDFRRLWSEDGIADAHAALAAAIDDRSRRAALIALYDEARETVHQRLRKLAARYAELDVRSYLDTPEQYRFLVDLHARGRVVALRGDFTRDGLLREVAGVLTEHGQSVTILYLSNIEQYFAYRRPFKDNMLALPFDDDTVVLRTLPGRPAGFEYIVQAGDDFHAWMRARKVWSVYGIRPFTKGEPLEADKRFVVGPPPAATIE